MRVVFMGFQTWGHLTLKGLLESDHEVVLVITHPESNHVYETIWNDSVKALATENEIPVMERVYANDPESVEAVRQARADIIVSSDWRTWLSSEVLSIPRWGGINIHDALLPRYGGFAPINWSIIHGETRTGVTVHQMNDDLDLGDILLQRSVEIGPDETATDIFQKTLPLFPGMILETLDLIASGKATYVPQDYSQATFFHKRTERDSLIDWNRPCRDVYNLIRAQSDPYPNAFTYFEGKRLRIKQAARTDKHYGGTPGRVFCQVPQGVVVLCGRDGSTVQNQGIILVTVQEEGGEPVPATEYFRKMSTYLGS